MSLLQLPNEVACTLLSTWVGLKDCVRLDSAYCNKISRPILLDSFKDSLILQSAPSHNHAKNFMRWLCLRSIRTSKMLIFNCREAVLGDNDYLEYLAICSNYFSYAGRSILNLDIQRCFLPVFDLVALYCSNLECVSIDSCDMGSTLWTILATNPHLTELNMEACSFEKHIESAKNSASCNLQKLYIENIHGRISDDDLVPLVGLFPNLKTLHLRSNQSTAETFTSVLKMCSKIVNLSMHDGREDGSTMPLEVILNNVKTGLRALNLAEFMLTADIVETIISYHASTLQHLKVNITASGALYVRLLNACSALRTLDISDSDEEELPAVLPNLRLPKLHSLMCDTYDDALMDSIVEGTHYSPELSTLCLYGRADPRLYKYIQLFDATRPSVRKIILYGNRTNLRYIRVGTGKLRKEESVDVPLLFDLFSFPTH